MTTLKLAFIWLQIRYLEIHVAGCNECLECVTDPERINLIHESRLISKREIHRLKSIQALTRMQKSPWRIA